MQMKPNVKEASDNNKMTQVVPNFASPTQEKLTTIQEQDTSERSLEDEGEP